MRARAVGDVLRWLYKGERGVCRSARVARWMVGVYTVIKKTGTCVPALFDSFCAAVSG